MIEPEFMVNDFLEERQELENIINAVNPKEKKFHKEAYFLSELIRHAVIHYKKADNERMKRDLEHKKKMLLEKINQIKSNAVIEAKPEWTPIVEKPTEWTPSNEPKTTEWTPNETESNEKAKWVPEPTELEISKAPEN